uniref:Putative acetylcholinesterase/butyrylcholinesterase n=1 Tax=Anopheles braziliensis TaxID=58242 RepID=A0A2M3ZM90_9DIPT
MHRFVAAVLRLVVALVSGWWARFCLRFRSPSTICTVTIGPGKLRGVTVTAKGIRYHYFKGIRYAEPPIGDLRFKVARKDAQHTHNA